MTAFVYQYRIAGEQKVWQVRSSYEQDELREALERKTGKLDLLLLVRSATEHDSRLPCVHTVADITAEWDKAVAKLRGEQPTDHRSAADTWDQIFSELRGKDKAAAEPAADSWDSVMKYVMKQRKDTA
jgi:hypothetical protein